MTTQQYSFHIAFHRAFCGSEQECTCYCDHRCGPPQALDVRYCANLAAHEHTDDHSCQPTFIRTTAFKACHCRKSWGGRSVHVQGAAIILLYVLLNLASQCSTCRMLASYGREAPSCAPKGQCSGSSRGPNDAVAGPYGPSTWAEAYNFVKLLMYVGDDALSSSFGGECTRRALVRVDSKWARGACGGSWDGCCALGSTQGKSFCYYSLVRLSADCDQRPYGMIWAGHS